MINLFFWRSFCPSCWAHIKGYMWVEIAGSYAGHHLASCPRCNKVVEKYDTLSEEGFGRAVRLQEDPPQGTPNHGYQVFSDIYPGPVWKFDEV